MVRHAAIAQHPVGTMAMDLIDIVILSNGPGEVMTWVRPVVRALRSPGEGPEIRISVVLAPCPHASGQEVNIVRQFPEVNRVQGPEGFWPFMLWGKTLQQWDWATRGVVLYLGGDQFSAVALGKRLGYKIVTYAEWEPRWLRWIDACGLAQDHLQTRVPAQWRSKIHIVGDLIAEAQVMEEGSCSVATLLDLAPGTELVGLLPGSKPAKLLLGVPLGLAIAEYLHHVRPQVQMIIPVAPSLTLGTLQRYADPQTNPHFGIMQGCPGTLVQPDQGLPYLETEGGAKILLWTCTPAYDLLVRCQLCLTTVGANTAELASLAVPMLVLLPTQQLDIMRAWDGIPGLLANLPGIGTGFARLINRWILSQGLGLRAWPNIWAGREIVPEWVGHLSPTMVGDRTLSLLQDHGHLETMRTELQKIRGKPGAAKHIAELVQNVLVPKATENNTKNNV